MVFLLLEKQYKSTKINPNWIFPKGTYQGFSLFGSILFAFLPSLHAICLPIPFICGTKKHWALPKQISGCINTKPSYKKFTFTPTI